MARLTFNEVAERAQTEGLDLIRLTRGYKFEDSAFTFKNLDAVVEYLENVQVVNLVKEELEIVEDLPDVTKEGTLLVTNPEATFSEATFSEDTLESNKEIFENELLNQVEISTITQSQTTTNNYWESWQNSYQSAVNKLSTKTEPSQVPAFDNPVWIGLIFVAFIDILFNELKLIYLQIEKKLNQPQSFQEMYQAAKIVSKSESFATLQNLKNKFI